VNSLPELPEVETVRRGLAPVMEGARFRLAAAANSCWPIYRPAMF
jgi:formamidopyrimidine-DNA glycosylase